MIQTPMDRRRFLKSIIGSVVAAGAPLPIGMAELDPSKIVWATDDIAWVGKLVCAYVHNGITGEPIALIERV